ncbi:MAG: carbon storage regulator [Planctomycetia bacterium]|nr:carbon storage regulator [Planctomycetia bacterium]
MIDACYDSQLCFVESRNSRVRLGIEAPACTGVHRKEVWDALQ